jgi:hypothetical protein
MNSGAVFDKLLDPYEVKARLFPGLLVLLPAVLYLALLYGTKSPMIVALSTVLAACGGPYLLSSFVRTWGQRAQDRLYRRWGAQPSTIMLRHRDATLPLQTKLRYHELAASRLGVDLPTAEAEQRDPGNADQAYASAADALRPLTNDRKAFPFVFKELVAYGFNRNAYGSRWVGLGFAAITLIATLSHAGALLMAHPFVNPAALGVPHIVVLVWALVMSVLWCAHFTAETVKLAGMGYAKRLWEALEKVPKKTSRPPRKAPAPAEIGAAVARP